MLNVLNLDFDYPDTPLLKNINFSLSAGQLLHLQGENGKGKTTLLKLLAGLKYPTAGKIEYPEHTRCYVGHKTGVSTLLTVKEYWFLELLRESCDAVSFETAIAQFGLEGLENLLCGLLSAGQRQRVGLLRLLVSKAKLWLLDEPFSALDVQSTGMLKSLIEGHLAAQGMVILTAHQALPFEHCSYKAYQL